MTGPRLAAVVGVYTVAVLWAEARVGAAGHLLLTAATWVLLVLALLPRSDLWRARALAVVAVATVGELLGSQLLGLYEYRAGHLPGFVPPGHGLVFLAGCALAEGGAIKRHANHFVAAVGALAICWGLIGAFQATSPDVSGAFGAVAFMLIMLAAPLDLRPYYAGVFIAVSALELIGTAIGTWQWAPVTTIVGLPSGNPPSGAASGYCLFDMAGFMLAPALLALLGRRGGRRVATA